jgi:glycosyltransferase involved in cell wall biosynthesis
VKEALACNLPVVSTDVGDVRERIQDIEGCEIVFDDAPQAIAHVLEKVIRRSQPIDGRSHVLSLDEKIITNRVIEVYQQALLAKNGELNIKVMKAEKEKEDGNYG